MIGFTFSFEGNTADNFELDFYDTAKAMQGFQRTLAITTHLILNGKVITQAPALKNARIMVHPSEEGSFKIPAVIVLTGLYALGTAPKDTPIGHLIHSAYDYVIHESLGFHVDYDETLGKSYEKLQKNKKKIPVLEQSQFDSVIEKCENSVIEMHRPIVKSKSAQHGTITFQTEKKQIPFNHPLNKQSYDFIHTSETDKNPLEITGRISSYNINTFNGRIFIMEERRPIPFYLSEDARTPKNVTKIIKSLGSNAVDRFFEGGNIRCMVLKTSSRTGRLKSLLILEVL